MNSEPKKIAMLKSYRFVSILDRMIAKDLMKTVFAVLSVIVVIIVSRKFIKVLTLAIEGLISNETVLNILGLNTVLAMTAFLPAAVFIAILIVLGRMYRDQEMAAVASAGGGAGAIYRAVFLLVFPLAMLAASLSFITAPWAEAEIRALIHEDRKEADVRGLVAGQFKEYGHGDLVFYTQDIEKSGRMRDVFVQSRESGTLGIINAKYGWLKNLSGGLYLVLEQGERILGLPGEMNFIIENFTEYAIRIEKKTSVLMTLRDGVSSGALWQSNNVLDTAELQLRLSIPLGVIFLAFLAVPLAKLSPRGGVYGSLAIAFAIYFVYGNLKRVIHSWVVNGVLPISFGYFAVYLLLILLGGTLLVRLYGKEWIILQLKQRSKK